MSLLIRYEATTAKFPSVNGGAAPLVRKTRKVATAAIYWRFHWKSPAWAAEQVYARDPEDISGCCDRCHEDESPLLGPEGMTHDPFRVA